MAYGQQAPVPRGSPPSRRWPDEREDPKLQDRTSAMNAALLRMMVPLYQKACPGKSAGAAITEEVCRVFCEQTAPPSSVEPDLRSFEIVVEACRVGGFPDRALNLAQMAAARGFQVHLSPVIQGCLHSAWQQWEQHAAPPAPTPPAPKWLLQSSQETVLKALRACKDGHQALRVLKEARLAQEALGKPLPEQAYVLCAQLVTQGHLQLVQPLVQELRLRPSSEAYEVLAKALGAKGHFDQALRILDEMRMHLEPTAGVLNAVLEAAVRVGRLDVAFDIFKQMLDRGHKAQKYIVASLMKAVGEDKGKVRKAVNLVERFLNEQASAGDEVVFNTLLDGCCRLEDMTKIDRTLEHMRTIGCTPSGVTFGTLIKAYGRQGDATKVLRAWDEMQGCGIVANVVTYGCMLDACVKCGCFDKMREVFDDLKSRQQHRNTIIYSTLVKGYCKRKDLEQALKVKQEMEQEQVALNTVTYNSLIDVCIRCRSFDVATSLVEEMRMKRIKLDLITYSTLIKGYCSRGELAMALELRALARGHGLRCDEILYNSLLDGCIKSGEGALAEGEQLFAEMVAEGVRPSTVTFAILIKLYGRHNRIDEAFKLVETMESAYGVKPGHVVFVALVKACLKCGKTDAACRLLLDLPYVGNVKPELQTYASVLTRLAQEQEATSALRLLDVVIGKHGPRGSAVAVAAAVVPVLEALNDQPLPDAQRAKLEHAVHRVQRSLVGAGADKADQGRRKQLVGKLAQLQKALEEPSAPETKTSPWGTPPPSPFRFPAPNIWGGNNIWAPEAKKGGIPGDVRGSGFSWCANSEGDTTLPFMDDASMATMRSTTSTPEVDFLGRRVE